MIDLTKDFDGRLELDAWSCEFLKRPFFDNEKLLINTSLVCSKKTHKHELCDAVLSDKTKIIKSRKWYTLFLIRHSTEVVKYEYKHSEVTATEFKLVNGEDILVYTDKVFCAHE